MSGRKVGPDDPRYEYLVRRGNQRVAGKPGYVHLANSTEQVIRAVDEAVRHDYRFAVRSGGHCFKNSPAAAGCHAD